MHPRRLAGTPVGKDGTADPQGGGDHKEEGIAEQVDGFARSQPAGGSEDLDNDVAEHGRQRSVHHGRIVSQPPGPKACDEEPEEDQEYEQG